MTNLVSMFISVLALVGLAVGSTTEPDAPKNSTPLQDVRLRPRVPPPGTFVRRIIAINKAAPGHDMPIDPLRLRPLGQAPLSTSEEESSSEEFELVMDARIREAAAERRARIDPTDKPTKKKGKKPNKGPIARLMDPGAVVKGAEFANPIDASTCDYHMNLLQMNNADFLRAGMFCSVIAGGPAEHCSVVFYTRTGALQMDFTADLNDPPTQLFVKCRNVWPDQETALANTVVIPAAHAAAAAGVRPPEVYFDAGGHSIINSDPNLGPYRLYPRDEDSGPPIFPMNRIRGVIVAPEFQDTPLVAAVHLFIRKTPNFFQLLTRDCQTFSTNVMNRFTTGVSTRVNNVWYASAYMRIFYNVKKCYAYPLQQTDYASEFDLRLLRADLAVSRANLLAGMPMPRVVFRDQPIEPVIERAREAMGLGRRRTAWTDDRVPTPKADHDGDGHVSRPASPRRMAQVKDVEDELDATVKFVTRGSVNRRPRV